ncbi:PREDICTED: probable serine/threonine-protein kinase DDB_G0293276 isoform X4 [Populus euphratica]|uniref:Probable serine/threonine-protein kinase DDB_G0293276 isoform X4 n=1 Tax=Populus euphratica TaxID=75702 RepID=A0AAJ6VHD9_POPEU|nr:PREDICTED: probable serine/threonine-protein kinase DDB_G0293276 isoform X4 [Populus euphratica]
MAGPEAEAEAGRAVPDMEAVLDFLRKNGLKDAELALKEDMIERSNELGSFDFEKFLFVLPPVRVPSSVRQLDVEEGGGAVERLRSSSGSPSDDEFVSLGSSTSASEVYSSEFSNPYGLRSTSQANSETSSDRLSQFGTARDYPDFDMKNDWYDEKEEGHFMSPCFNGPDYFGCPSEDKFVMTSETGKQFENSLGLYDKSEGETQGNIDYLDKQCLYNVTSVNNKNEAQSMNYHHDFDKKTQLEGDIDRDGSSAYNCKFFTETGGIYGKNSVDCIYTSSKGPDLGDFQLKVVESPTDYDIVPVHTENKNANYYGIKVSKSDWTEGFKSTSGIVENGIDDFEVGDGGGVNGETHELAAAIGGEDVNANELLMYYNQEDEYEVFNLRVIHRKNRSCGHGIDPADSTLFSWRSDACAMQVKWTGFEENKDLPIVLNSVIAGRYYVTEYLGSAAFSKVIQAHDLHTGIDVCLKIIKNDKDFFDQSLDEIKLLKIVNKLDPADERHILRLYDYFYHQEHLFIVCELLKANLYEFQKFNQESGGEAYFTLSRLQVITRQCLEALEYLHHLGIIHCDLKPENILIKSYRKCEIKVIDLGSSCFKSDNLCLYVQSRSYRAPEVILGLPYDQKIDLWSLGCILAELCSGEVLFPNDAVVMILTRMIGMLGPIDPEMLETGQDTHKYFTEEYDLYHLNEETNQVEFLIPEESSLEHHLQVSDVGFIDFVRDLLELNPLRRPTAREALEHPWLSHSY